MRWHFSLIFHFLWEQSPPNPLRSMFQISVSTVKASTTFAALIHVKAWSISWVSCLLTHLRAPKVSRNGVTLEKWGQEFSKYPVQIDCILQNHLNWCNRCMLDGKKFLGCMIGAHDSTKEVMPSAVWPQDEHWDHFVELFALAAYLNFVECLTRPIYFFITGQI